MATKKPKKAPRHRLRDLREAMKKARPHEKEILRELMAACGYKVAK